MILISSHDLLQGLGTVPYAEYLIPYNEEHRELLGFRALPIVRILNN
jgi:hypothetical protein